MRNAVGVVSAACAVVLAASCSGQHSNVLAPIAQRRATSSSVLSIVQTATITGSTGATLHSPPTNGDLLIAIAFNGISTIGCASGWTSIRHVTANYDDAQSCYRIASGDTATETPFSGTAGNIAGEIWEIAGEQTTGFIDAETGAEAGPRTVTLTFSPSHSGDLIVGASAMNTMLTGVTPTGFTVDSSSSPAGSTGFSDLSAHQNSAQAGTQSVTWTYNSTTDTHPVTADMIAIAGTGATATPSPSPTPSPTPAPTPTPTPTPGSAVNWPTMGYDVKRSGYNPSEHTLGTSNVSGIHNIWSTSIGGQIGEPIYASNVVIKSVKTNVLYVSDGGGTAWAINADTGAVLWTHQMGTSSYMCGTGTYTFGANGTPVFDRTTNRVYFSDGAANVHAFNMSTGKEVAGWPVNIATPANHNFIYSALTYNHENHTLYAETSSTCDISPWYGRIAAINTTTAAITNTFYPAQGVSGGGIWGFGGASIDPSTNDVYIATGNSDTSNGGSQSAGYSEQVVALSPDLSSVLGNYYAQLPPGPDSDFGATPLLFKPPGCPLLAAAVNKSGLFVLYNAGNISAGPLQTIDMSISSDNGDFVGVPAYDPVTNYVYVGLPSTFGIYNPGMGAFGVQSNCTLNPTPVWNAAFGADGAVLDDDTLRSPISIANGVVYVSHYDTGVAYAFNAATGSQLWTHTLSGKGVVGPIVANGHLYTSDITGKIQAWSP